MRPLLLRLLAFAAALAACEAGAVTYLVDARTGDDRNSGTTVAAPGAPAGPWQSMARLATAPLLPGDTVELACGSVWNETLKVNAAASGAAPIVVAAASANCQQPPLIDGAVAIPASAWVQHSGAIYRTTLPANLAANPSTGTALAGWTQWSPGGDATLAVDVACPGQTTPCLAFTSGSRASLAISNTFALAGNADYTVAVQVRAAAGTRLKVSARRGGPTYENLAPDTWVTASGAWQSVQFTMRPRQSLGNARIDIEVPGARILAHLRDLQVRAAVAQAPVLATYVDGMAVRRAHHPNFSSGAGGGSPYAAIAGAGGKLTLDTTGLALPSGATLTPGLSATIRTINWSIEERAVAAVSGARLTLASPTNYDLLPGYGFFLSGALWMLDAPGEWHYDGNTSTLYVWMPDGQAPGNRVAASSLAVGVDLNGRSNVTVQGLAVRHVETGVNLSMGLLLALEGMQVSDVAGHGIDATNCNQCSVADSAIARTGLDAVTAGGILADAFTLVDSDIADSGASARQDGWRMLPRPANAAVYAGASNASVLRTNIRGTAHMGVFLGSDGFVSENRFSAICLTLNDCGAIYASGAGNGATITGNLVDSVVGNSAGLSAVSSSHAVGIYLDEGNAGSRVSGNTVTGADYGIQLHDASAATVTGNVLFGNRRRQMWLQEKTNATRAAGAIFDNLVTGNLMVPTTLTPGLLLESFIGPTQDFGVFATNGYSALLSQQVIEEIVPGAAKTFTLADWQAAGRETGARQAELRGYFAVAANAVNRVPNGGFTVGDSGWTAWNQTSPPAALSVRNCSFGPCAEFRSGGSTTLFSSPNFSVTGGQYYRVSFDAMTPVAGQPLQVVVRRGGGGTASYEYLMPAAERFSGSTTWRRYSFTFQASKTVTAGDPVTRELGARLDFERNAAGSVLNVARIEMVPMTPPADVALHIKMLLNGERTYAGVNCDSLGVPASQCAYFVYFDDGTPVTWPASVAPLTGRPVYTRDSSRNDADGDGISDQQDACPATPAGQAVNSKGCGIGQ